MVAFYCITAHAQWAAHSVLASGSWYKLTIPRTDVYKVDYAFATGILGAGLSSVSFSEVAVYGIAGGMLPESNSISRPDDLVELPTWVYDANSNNVFENGDFILFYAQGADVWKYNTALQVFHHQRNIYSNESYCFLTLNRGTGKRIQTTPSAAGANFTVSQFDELIYHNSDEVNPSETGRLWLGDRLSTFSNQKSFTESLPGYVTGTPVNFQTSVVSNSTSFGSQFLVNVNSQQLMNINVTSTGTGDYHDYVRTAYSEAPFVPSSTSINIGYTFQNSDPTGMPAGWIDWYELVYQRHLTAGSAPLHFRSAASAAPGRITAFNINGADANLSVWDVSNPLSPVAVNGSLNGNTYSVVLSTDTLREFVALNPFGSIAAPGNSGAVANQDIHGQGQPDMVIVTHPDFENAANRLADFHRQSAEALEVIVVKLSELYNEFSGGRQDVSAIRDMMRMFYNRASNESEKPRYLCLFGTGSYDFKGLESGTFNMVPTYQSFESINPLSSLNTDDYFGLLDDTDGELYDNNDKMDVAIGRLPVQTAAEAEDMVNKIIRYKTYQSPDNCKGINKNNSWRSSITFIADDEDSNIHLASSEGLAEFVRINNPKYNIEKIYMDAYKQVNTSAGKRYPDASSSLINRFNSGSLVFNYVGHGSIQRWAHEVLIDQSAISRLDNADRLPLIVTATCEFSRYDLKERTAGELFLLNKNGGAIALITTVRVVYSSQNAAMNTALYNHLFEEVNGKNHTMGELMMLAKNDVNADHNNRKFTLLGDPALRLNYPEYNVATTHINNQPIDQQHDTLKALSTIEVKGEVRDDDNQLLTGFNGFVYATVYDKISSLQTLKNDPASVQQSFLMYKNILFKGKASVTDGKFAFTFVVPQDINYSLGEGRIAYYADNGLTDASGATQSGIVVGGSSDVLIDDNEGPVVNVFMNDENFIAGGITDESPLMLVKLFDEHGINTTGTSVGHDIMAYLDGDDRNPIVLNDFYETDLNGYQSGRVRYPFNNLAEGTHSLRVKAWDILNNSGEGFTEFIVANSAQFAVVELLNYPNPFRGETRFSFETNRCCTDFETTIEIFSLTGEKMITLHDLRYNESYRVADIAWDGTAQSGSQIASGTYIYRLTIIDKQGGLAQKTEKLVLIR